MTLTSIPCGQSAVEKQAAQLAEFKVTTKLELESLKTDYEQFEKMIAGKSLYYTAVFVNTIIMNMNRRTGNTFGQEISSLKALHDELMAAAKPT